MNLLLIAIACGVIAVLYGIFTSRQVLAPPGQPAHGRSRRRHPGRRAAYLRRQYTTIAIVGVIVAVIVGIFLGLTRQSVSSSAHFCRASPASSG
jgi:K(+)-stimulated pyrophosphate-energized sodium pump